MAAFKIGDRVRVASSHIVPEMRGAVGTITEPTKEVRDYIIPTGAYWVEFDALHP